MASKAQPGSEVVNPAMPTAFQRLIARMDLEATMDSEEGRFSGDDLNQILEAETEEEMWEADERGPLNTKHLAGCELDLLDVQVKYSRGENEMATPFITAEGRKMYLLVTAARLSNAGEKQYLKLPEVGQQFEFNTSARFVVAKLIWLVDHGKIYYETGAHTECVVVATDLGGGQAVNKLKPLPKRAYKHSAE